MVAAHTQHRSRAHSPSWLVLAGFVVLTVGSGVLVGLVNDPGTWYDGLDKAPLNPPSAVFGPVWTVLYVMIGVSGYLAWRSTRGAARTNAMTAWTVQLVLPYLAWVCFATYLTAGIVVLN